MKRPAKTPATMTALRDDLLLVYAAIRNGSIEPEQARQLVTTAGKIIGSAMAQIEYAAARNEEPRIPFLR